MQPDELTALIEKYLNGTATAGETRDVLEWYRSIDHSYIEIPIETVDEKQLIRERILHNLQLYTGQQTRPVKHIYRFNWAAAAAVLLLLAGGIYFIMHRSVPERSIPPAINYLSFKNDVPPGTSKATLRLGNGKIIFLDSMANGVLVSQGSSKVEKVDSGLLAYNQFTSHRSPLTAIQYNTLTTPRGGQYQVILPDGSKVWLNAASSIHYPTAFTGKQREVEITGEAYFEVTANPSMPFIVKKGDAVVQVLGTHFDINAYDDAPAIKVSLLEGSVKVTALATQSAQLLEPGEQAQVNEAGEVKVINDADVEGAIAWKNGYFHFNNTDITLIMQEVERWYDIRVVYQGKLTTDLFQGDIPRTASLVQLLTILQYSRVHFRLEGRTLTVLP